MKDVRVAEFEACLIGRSCVVKRREYDWTFDLSDDVSLVVGDPWRIIAKGRIAFSSEDDGHTFGRPSPVDSEVESRKWLSGRSITTARLDLQTADLTLEFDAAIRIDVFRNSVGYEGWQATYAIGGRRRSLITLGGGDLMFVEP